MLLKSERFVLGNERFIHRCTVLWLVRWNLYVQHNAEKAPVLIWDIVVREMLYQYNIQATKHISSQEINVSETQLRCNLIYIQKQL